MQSNRHIVEYYNNIIKSTSKPTAVDDDGDGLQRPEPRDKTSVSYHLDETVEILSVDEWFLEIHIAVDVRRKSSVFDSEIVTKSKIENPRMGNVQCL